MQNLLIPAVLKDREVATLTMTAKASGSVPGAWSVRMSLPRRTMALLTQDGTYHPAGDGQPMLLPRAKTTAVMQFRMVMN